MKITPIISNEVEIEHEGIILNIHCSDGQINVSSESKIEYPSKYAVGDLVDKKAVKFVKRGGGD